MHVEDIQSPDSCMIFRARDRDCRRWPFGLSLPGKWHISPDHALGNEELGVVGMGCTFPACHLFE